jgi:acetate---CoA ligase (ADP-forming)
MPDLSRFFSPRSIAIIGASPDATKVRGRIMALLLEGGFDGAIYPVNPSHTEVMGRQAYATVADIPEPFDLALVAITAENVPAALKDIAASGCRQAVIYSAGFAEAGGAEAAAREAELSAVAEAHGITLLGPNGVGFFNVADRIAATFSPGIRVAGAPRAPDGPGKRVVIVSQSGGLGFSIYQHAAARGIAVSHVVSTGNEAGIGVLDVIDHALDDKMIGCVLLYVEQFREPDRLRPVAEKALTRGVPIVLVKSGRSEAGRRAAVSHTASLVGDDKAHDAMFNHLGMFRVYDQGEMLDLAAAFTGAPLPASARVGVVSMSGGGAIWLTDACADAGLELPELSAGLQANLRSFVPDYGGITNPVDLTAQSLESDGRIRAMTLLYESDEVDTLAVVATLSEVGMLEREKEALAALAGRTEKPLVFCTYTLPREENLSVLADCGIPVFPSFTGCARGLKGLVDYAAFRARRAGLEDGGNEAPAIAMPTLAASARRCTEAELRPIFTVLGIASPPARIATSEDEIIAAARALSYPVVLKLQAGDIAHKTAAGAIALGVPDDASLRAAALEIRARTGRAEAPFLVQAMAEPGLDVIVGIIRDEDFGALLVVGAGGTTVEATDDVAISPVPLDAPAAESLLRQVRALAPYWNDAAPVAPGIDNAALINAVVKVSAFAAANRHVIAEFEINPLRIFAPGDGALALDGFMRTGTAQGETTDG